jgi:diacylglycerol kinase family enzyme
VDPPGRPVLFINPRSGGGKAARAALADRARERGIEPVTLGPGDDLAALVAEAVDGGADALGVAGGDGSLAIGAAAAAGRDLPFICLPAGTRNHFALDLGIARRDLIGSLDAFTEGVERRVDIAEANGRLFLNNVSLGVYGDAVQRPEYRGAKVKTILATADKVLSTTAPTPAMRITDDSGHQHTSPLLVLISNNPYALEKPLVQGSRPRLDTGRLGIIVVDRPDTRPPPVSAWTARSVDLSASAQLPAGLDGEAITLVAPVRFMIRSEALRVRISAHHSGISPAALVSAR